MTTSTSMFPCWAIVEVMGHQRYAGMVHEQQVAGVGMLRIDVPAVELVGRCVGLEAYTKLVGVASIYALTPCTEQMAREFAAMIRKRPFELYDVPRIGNSSVRSDDIDDNDLDGYLNQEDPV